MTNKEVNNKGELIYQHTQFWNKSMTVHRLPRTTLNTATAGSGYGRSSFSPSRCPKMPCLMAQI